MVLNFRSGDVFLIVGWFSKGGSHAPLGHDDDILYLNNDLHPNGN